jgi:hypothetical protein
MTPQKPPHHLIAPISTTSQLSPLHHDTPEKNEEKKRISFVLMKILECIGKFRLEELLQHPNALLVDVYKLRHDFLAALIPQIETWVLLE